MQGSPPKARAVYDMLASRILTGNSLAGDILLSAPEKTLDVAVAKNTLSAAMNLLREDGLVRVDRRRNRVVDGAVLPAAVLNAARLLAKISQQHDVGVDSARLAVLGMWDVDDSALAGEEDVLCMESADAVVAGDDEVSGPAQDVLESVSPQSNALYTQAERSEAVSPSRRWEAPIDPSESDASELADITVSRDEDPDTWF